MTDEDLLQRLLYRDALMLVVDKPAGIPVHAGPGGGETLDQHFDVLRFGLPRAPALAHRLDRDTSGCLVLGRHRRSTAELGELFARQKVAKTYLAVVCGALEGDEGVIDAPLAKVAHDRRSWWMRVDPAGQPSLTEWRVVARGDTLTVVDLMPRTGRTHQLRVHMAQLGHPIVGDGVYGGDRARGVDKRLHLHARRIEVPLYRKKPAVVVEAPVPEHMGRLLRRLGYLPQDASMPDLGVRDRAVPMGTDASASLSRTPATAAVADVASAARPRATPADDGGDGASRRADPAGLAPVEPVAIGGTEHVPLARQAVRDGEHAVSRTRAAGLPSLSDPVAPAEPRNGGDPAVRADIDAPLENAPAVPPVQHAAAPARAPVPLPASPAVVPSPDAADGRSGRDAVAPGLPA